jgi:hypothetical protein
VNITEKTSFQLLLAERGPKALEILLNKIRTEYPIDWARRPEYKQLLEYVQTKVGS